MFILVRHGHAGAKGIWPFAEVERPLSQQGWQQADGVTRNLSGIALTRLVSSPYRRCVQTLLPLAEETGLPVEHADMLGPTDKVKRLDAELATPQDGITVMCTHGETLLALLQRWAKQGTVSLPVSGKNLAKDTTGKGGAWVIADSGKGKRAAHYVRPLHVIELPSEQRQRDRRTVAS